MPTGKLIVEVFGADSVKKKQLLGGHTPKTFVFIKVGDKSFKTKVVKGDEKPTWNEKFAIDCVESMGEQLGLELKDVINHGKEEVVLGQVLLNFGALTRNGGKTNDAWFPLKKDGGVKAKARVHVAMKFEPPVSVQSIVQDAELPPAARPPVDEADSRFATAREAEIDPLSEAQEQPDEVSAAVPPSYFEELQAPEESPSTGPEDVDVPAAVEIVEDYQEQLSVEQDKSSLVSPYDSGNGVLKGMFNTSPKIVPIVTADESAAPPEPAPEVVLDRTPVAQQVVTEDDGDFDSGEGIDSYEHDLNDDPEEIGSDISERMQPVDTLPEKEFLSAAIKNNEIPVKKSTSLLSFCECWRIKIS